MASFNKVILIGNLCRDPEIRYTPKGVAICQIGLAVNRRWKDADGNEKEDVTFIDITTFGKCAEICAQYLKKGRSAMFEGRLQLDTWDDKQTGQKRSKLKVIAEQVQFLGGGKKDDDGVDNDANDGVKKSRPANKGGGHDYSPDADGPPPEDDDVPF